MNYSTIRTVAKKHKLLAILITSLFVMACEAPMEEGTSAPVGNVCIKVNSFDLIPFSEYYSTTKASVGAQELCSRLTFAIYTEGERVGNINQIRTDKDFGKVSLSLEAGTTYQIVVIGYSGMGYATTTNGSKITFSNSHVSDTFWTCEEITVGETASTVEVDLKRIVACVHFQFTDEEIPATLKNIKCFYTGGSSTLNGFTGYGSVNSNQKEELTLSNDNSFDIYTFPHYDSDILNITVQAIDNDGVVIAERVFQDVSIKMNYISNYTGEFFTDTDNPNNKQSGTDVTVKGDNEWAGQTEHTF